MTAEPIASGREADVFALDDTRVLRRYRTGADVTSEAEVMAYVAGLGFPVPRLYEAGGTDMVLERLDGPTLAATLLAGEMSPAEGAALLADLLRRLHELPGRQRDSIVHLDLHPDNVLMTGRGPVVIDWHNAGDGPGDLDTGFSALILAEVALTFGPAVEELLDHFLAVAPGDPRRLLDEVVAMRSGQPTLSPEEIARLPVAADRVRGVK